MDTQRTTSSPAPTSTREPEPDTSGMPLWLRGVLPLVLLIGLVAVFLRFGPLGVFRAAFPPVEELTIERVTFPSDGMMRLHLVNGGPEPVTVAQVTVEDAYWDFSMDPPNRTIDRLGSATVDIPYPWVDGEPIGVKVLTSTGVTFDHVADVATLSPEVGPRYLSTFALLGLYVGVIPVFLGLLWLPFLRGVGDRGLRFFLALTVGLLVFIGVEALAESIELASGVASAFQGIGLITLGILGAPLCIEAVGRLKKREPSTSAAADRSGASDGQRTAFLIALGIGMHNLGEGLAVGSAYAVGEIGLGTMLVLGFLLHNTTEGIGIVAPIARERPTLQRLVVLGLIAGAPTILGAFIGGFTYSPPLSVLFMALGAGAVFQVVWTLGRFLAKRSGPGGLGEPLNALGVAAGLAIMWGTGLLVAL
jgi:zinc transporter, ZIP family